MSSRVGEGTTVMLKLPLTLAIIDGFLTKIGAEHFVFPLSLVEECVELKQEDRKTSRGRVTIVTIPGSPRQTGCHAR